METKRIMFLGPSGSGKTTLAKYISDEFNIPFISGSYSDIVPSTRQERHQDMLDKDFNTLVDSELDLLKRRYNTFDGIEGNLVTDRSYIDNLVYSIYKLSYKVKEATIRHIFRQVVNGLKEHCTHIIFIPIPYGNMVDWKIEDNNKRILNRYFQWMVYTLMENVLLEMLSYRDEDNYLDSGYVSVISNVTRKPIKVLILSQIDIDCRKLMIQDFLSDEE